MKLLFATQLCHKDVETFIFNWFSCRVHLSEGFSIPHLITNDGTLTQNDLYQLKKLINVFVEEVPIQEYPNVPKVKLLCKLRLFELGFLKYNADRVVIIDADVFFYRPWDSDFARIFMSEAIAMMDFGSSLGPNYPRYVQDFGVEEDAKTPTCNTGIVSTKKEHYPRVVEQLNRHLQNPYMIMEDQGVCFAAFHGMLDYIKSIKVLVNGAGEHPIIWNWVLAQNGAHLVGMKGRKQEYESLVNHTLKLLPERLHPKIFKPLEYRINGGMLAYDTYFFGSPYSAYPGRCNGIWSTDAVYLSGNSYIYWTLPPQITKFECSVMVMDDSIKENCSGVMINGRMYATGRFYIIDIINRTLSINAPVGDRTYYALTMPRLHYYLDRPTSEFL